MSNTYQKTLLQQQHGSLCMLCERTLKKHDQSFHHRVPRSHGGKGSVENGAILCSQCHRIIHLFEYGTEAYEKLDKLIEKNMKKHKR